MIKLDSSSDILVTLGACLDLVSEELGSHNVRVTQVKKDTPNASTIAMSVLSTSLLEIPSVQALVVDLQDEDPDDLMSGIAGVSTLTRLRVMSKHCADMLLALVFSQDNSEDDATIANSWRKMKEQIHEEEKSGPLRTLLARFFTWHGDTLDTPEKLKKVLGGDYKGMPEDSDEPEPDIHARVFILRGASSRLPEYAAAALEHTATNPTDVILFVQEEMAPKLAMEGAGMSKETEGDIQFDLKNWNPGKGGVGH